MKVDLSPDVIVLPDAPPISPSTVRLPATPVVSPDPHPSTAIRSVLMVCSTGGHLNQLHSLRKWWQRKERVWVTFDKEDARTLLGGEKVVWAYHPTTRNLVNAVRNLLLAARVLRRQRPDLVLSDGAGVAFPFFVVAKLFRIKTAYIEVCDRIDSATMTGRLCYPLADHFFLQCEEQKRFYPRGEMIGSLL